VRNDLEGHVVYFSHPFIITGYGLLESGREKEEEEARLAEAEIAQKAKRDARYAARKERGRGKKKK